MTSHGETNSGWFSQIFVHTPLRGELRFYSLFILISNREQHGSLVEHAVFYSSLSCVVHFVWRVYNCRPGLSWSMMPIERIVGLNSCFEQCGLIKVTIGQWFMIFFWQITLFGTFEKWNYTQIKGCFSLLLNRVQIQISLQKLQFTFRG